MRVLRLFAACSFLLVCAGSAAQGATPAKADWRSLCAERCRQPYAVTVYSPDNKATIYHMNIVSIDPPAGCLCPAPKK
jgi:hypothetical protein